jgi:hypothetical protein
MCPGLSGFVVGNDAPSCFPVVGYRTATVRYHPQTYSLARVTMMLQASGGRNPAPKYLAQSKMR